MARQRDAVEALLREDTSSMPHQGLVFERLLPIWEEQGHRFDWKPHRKSSVDVEDYRKRALDQFAASWKRHAKSNQEWLQNRHRRLDGVLSAYHRDGLEPFRKTFRTTFELAAGLGNPNPTENGLSLDWSTGVPRLPGSTVKGLARAGANLCEAKPEEIERCFGAAAEHALPWLTGESRAKEASRGRILFFDALPRVWPELALDVMTRHHDPEVIKKPDRKTPSETHAPNPVPFLTVKRETSFVFRIMDMPGVVEHDQSMLREVWDWLSTALEVLGAGGKTAVGYGQMKPVR